MLGEKGKVEKKPMVGAHFYKMRTHNTGDKTIKRNKAIITKPT